MREIDKAIKFFGTQSAIARALNVKPSTVSEWVSGERPVPPLRAFQMESISKGELSASKLNPKCNGLCLSGEQEAA